MADLRFRLSPLGKEDRSDFTSGSEPLDRYFRSQVGQDIRRQISKRYIASDSASGAIAGYYTISAASIPVPDIPEDLARRLPRYPEIPAVRLGRLAVDQRFRGLKLGTALLLHAVLRAATSGIGVHFLIVEAKDAEAQKFYAHHGFIAYGSAAGRLVAPLRTLLKVSGKD